ncbi:MAG: group III truncated hemoglobin [Ilumatobacteraceae bacterium]
MPDLVERSDVERLVLAFYRQAAMDSLLGPVFAASITDWNQHIETLVDFWCWQLFGERGYVGNPLRAHEPAHGRTPFTATHYERWVSLFVETTDETFAGPAADLAKSRAIKMARSMQRLLGGHEGRGDVATEVLWAGSRSL